MRSFSFQAWDIPLCRLDRRLRVVARFFNSFPTLSQISMPDKTCSGKAIGEKAVTDDAKFMLRVSTDDSLSVRSK
jgi:hypothetical protein